MKPSNVIFWLLVFFGVVDGVFYFMDAQAITIIGGGFLTIVVFIIWVILLIREHNSQYD